MAFKKTAKGWKVNDKKKVININGLLTTQSPRNKSEKRTKKEQK